MSEQEEVENLIAKHIVSEISPAEENKLQEWRTRSPDNEKYLKDALLIYRRAELNANEKFDSKSAWNKVSKHIHQKPKGRQVLFPFWKIAAGFLLIGALSYLIYSQIDSSQELNFQSSTEVQTQVLPDQTTLSLNRASQTKVTYDERKKSGLIELSGEALIDIPVDKKVTWKVKVNELIIEDIGTIFNVKAYPESTQIEVSVLEGEVRIFEADQERIRIQKGELVIYDKETKLFTVTQADQNIIAYQTRAFSFQNQELQTVVDQLAEVYQKEIILDGEIGSCTITVTFENEEIDEILSVIAATLGLTITEIGNQITLSGEGCS